MSQIIPQGFPLKLIRENATTKTIYIVVGWEVGQSGAWPMVIADDRKIHGTSAEVLREYDSYGSEPGAKESFVWVIWI